MILERIIIFYFLQKLFGTKGFFLEESIGKSPSVKICNNKILWVICREFMSLWAGSNKKNMNMVCIMIRGPFDAFRNSSFPLVLLFVFYSFIFGCAGSLLLCRLSLVAGSGGYSLVEVRGLCTAVASLVLENGFQACWL